MNAGHEIPSIVAAAERTLSQTHGREVRLGEAERLSDDERRNLLLRCRQVGGGAPATFIIKRIAGAYDPADTASWDTARFLSDWAGAEFLSDILPVPRTPRFYGGDAGIGFFILEDLGVHRSLVEPLLEEDAAGAERSLLAWSSCLGAVHAGTIGHAATFERLLRRRNLQTGARASFLSALSDRVATLQASLESLGVRVGSAFLDEVSTVIAAVENPGPFLAYVHGDPCPDNVFWNGEDARLIDFEFGGFGHALADAAYARMLFPSCWCANRVPADLVSKIEARYREELAKGCAEAQDDRTFESAFVTACAIWLLNTLSRLSASIEADREWGIATIRQRVLARLESFVLAAHEFDRMPALRGTAGQLLERLLEAWPEVSPLPLYPAFQRAAESAVRSHA